MKNEFKGVKIRMDYHNYEKTIQNLLEKIDVLENKLKSKGKDKIKLIYAYKNLDNESNFYKKENEQLNKNIEILKNKNLELEQKLDSIQSENEQIINNYRIKFDLLSKENEEKSEENLNLLKKIENLQEKNNILSINSNISQRFNEKQNLENEKYKLLSESQNKIIIKLQKEIDDLYKNKQTESNLLLENENLKKDNIRLIEMLKSTNEYSEFSYLNFTNKNGIKFVEKPKLDIRKKRDMFEQMKMKEEIKNNKKNWVPNEALYLIQDYNKKYNLNLNDKIIDDLLGSLNYFFKKEEKKRLNLIKIKYQKDLLDIKKKYDIKDINFNIDDNDNLNNDDNNLDKKLKYFEEQKQTEKIKNKVKKIQKKDLELKNSINQSNNIIKNDKNSAKNFIKIENVYLNEIVTLKDKLYNKEDNKKNKLNEILYKNNLILDKSIEELNKIKKNFNDLLLDFNNRIKEASLNIQINNSNSNIYSIQLINNEVQYLIKSMKDILDDSSNRFNLWKNKL